jgi:integrase
LNRTVGDLHPGEGRIDTSRIVYFTQEQLRQIIEAAPERYRVLFALLAATGLRVGEAAGLHLEDLDLDNGVIYVRRSVWNGQYAFRHSRVTLLRKNGTPADLQKLWIGHSSLRTTDRYAHTDQELEYRHREAARVGLDLIVGPNVANWTQSTPEREEPAKATV